MLIRVAKALPLEEAQGLLIIRLSVDQDHSGPLLDKKIGSLVQQTLADALALPSRMNSQPV